MADFPEPSQKNIEYLQGRSMLVRKMTPLPVKCMVRGYLTGTGWLEYRETGAIAENPLPEGMVESQRLPAPIFIPIIESTLAADDSMELQEYCGKFLSETLQAVALNLYFKAWKLARSRDVLLVATVYRFGLYEDRIHLIGECITPDSSQFSRLGSDRVAAPLYGSGYELLFKHRNSFQNLYQKLTKN